MNDLTDLLKTLRFKYVQEHLPEVMEQARIHSLT